MLMITGQKPVLKSKQGAFQIIDTVGLFNPLTKFNKQVGPDTEASCFSLETLTFSIAQHCRAMTNVLL